jgi:hypothetical protein
MLYHGVGVDTLLHGCDEAITAVPQRLDAPLGPATVADRPAGRDDTADQRRVADELTGP